MFNAFQKKSSDSNISQRYLDLRKKWVKELKVVPSGEQEVEGGGWGCVNCLS